MASIGVWLYGGPAHHIPNRRPDGTSEDHDGGERRNSDTIPIPIPTLSSSPPTSSGCVSSSAAGMENRRNSSGEETIISNKKNRKDFAPIKWLRRKSSSGSGNGSGIGSDTQIGSVNSRRESTMSNTSEHENGSGRKLSIYELMVSTGI